MFANTGRATRLLHTSAHGRNRRDSCSRGKAASPDDRSRVRRRGAGQRRHRAPVGAYRRRAAARASRMPRCALPPRRRGRLDRNGERCVTAPRPTSPRVLASAGPTISVAEAALARGISRGHAYAMVARGEWPTKVLRLGRRVRVPTAALRRLLEDDDLGGPAPSTSSCVRPRLTPTAACARQPHHDGRWRPPRAIGRPREASTSPDGDAGHHPGVFVIEDVAVVDAAARQHGERDA
jgi:predicted DNA-binding transcriptional regulator AlpA